MRRFENRMEYKKPTIELIVFNYSDVVASSGDTVMGNFSFSDEDSTSQTDTPVLNVWENGVEDNDGDQVEGNDGDQ